MSDQYFIFSNNSQSGPFPLEEIKQRLQFGELSAQTLVWQTGMTDWVPISNIIPGAAAAHPFPPSNIPVFANPGEQAIDFANHKFERYGPVSATKKVLSNYVNFNGRATRSEYWFFVLAMFIIYSLIFIIDTIAIVGKNQFLALVSVFLNLLSLGLLLPSLAVAVRRLHDIGKSGWYIFMYLIPLVGPFIVLYYYICDSQRGRNQWGQSEKYPSV